uniref:Band 7 domain-containing protein n=1 Tax=Meloidogyne incognita TaxID=6306 RepID=A0A914MYH1_MELIC
MTILHSLLSNPSRKKNKDPSSQTEATSSASHWVEVEDTRLGTTYKPSHVYRHQSMRFKGNDRNDFFANEPMTGNLGISGYILMVCSYILLALTFPIAICFCVKVVKEYERAVIFRLGRLLPGGARGPGIFIVIPCIDTYRKVDLRVLSFDVPPQEILSRDAVTVAVDVVVYFRISNATISVTNVEDSSRSTKIISTNNFEEYTCDREQISLQMQSTLDEITSPWGVKVERVEMKDVRLPVQLQRAMAAEAEATREAGAKIIAAEGEQKASKALSEAALIVSQSPVALQLRFLQTLSTISAEKNRTIIFPLPMEIVRHFIKRNRYYRQNK